MTTDYDIAVVGGGLAGASLACALAGSGLRIALVEAVALDAPADANMQARTTAISWGTKLLFEDLGLWSDMADEAAAIKRLHVSQQSSFGRVKVDAQDYGIAALGYVVANTTMIAALRNRLASLDRVELIAPARFEALSRQPDAVTLTLARDGQPMQLTTRLVVGADGANSGVREALGIGARFDDYGQSAIVTIVASERPHDGCAYERFSADGPIALLPRTPDSCAAVWTLPTAMARQALEMTDGEFIKALNDAFGHRLGRLELAGPRGAYPLARVLCDRAAVARAALIGNAGHALHPAAAQGFNLAVRDALTLARMLAERKRQMEAAGSIFDAGEADTLAAWAEARASDQHRVANFTDAIVRLFSNRVPGLGLARGAGLFGLSLAPGLRDDMARRSMGLALVPENKRSGAPAPH